MNKTSHLIAESRTEDRLVEALQPVRGMVAAGAIQALLASGLYDAIETAGEPGLDVARWTEGQRLNADRVAALVQFLVVEDLLESEAGRLRLTSHCRDIGEFRAWYEMLVGGYGATFLSLDKGLGLDGPLERDAASVGAGSCGISMYDSIPIVRDFVSLLTGEVRSVLDLGCGSAIYLTELCRDRPDLQAVGVEPDAGGCEAARAEISVAKMAGQVEIVQTSALQYIDQLDWSPDVVLLAFVLHEVLGQDGPEGVMRLLGNLFEVAPDTHLIVIDIDYRGTDRELMSQPLASAYYNGYFLLHPFTEQRLESREFWDQIFRQAGLEIVAARTTDPDVDSTEIEWGWLLRRARPETSL